MVSRHRQRPSVLPGMQVYAHATRSTVKKHVPHTHTHQKTIVKDFQLYAQEKNRGRFLRFLFFFFFLLFACRRNIDWTKKYPLFGDTDYSCSSFNNISSESERLCPSQIECRCRLYCPPIFIDCRRAP